jgi:hypothetical protein
VFDPTFFEKAIPTTDMLRFGTKTRARFIC